MRFSTSLLAIIAGFCLFSRSVAQLKYSEVLSQLDSGNEEKTVLSNIQRLLELSTVPFADKESKVRTFHLLAVHQYRARDLVGAKKSILTISSEQGIPMEVKNSVLQTGFSIAMQTEDTKMAKSIAQRVLSSPLGPETLTIELNVLQSQDPSLVSLHPQIQERFRSALKDKKLMADRHFQVLENLVVSHVRARDWSSAYDVFTKFGAPSDDLEHAGLEWFLVTESKEGAEKVSDEELKVYLSKYPQSSDLNALNEWCSRLFIRAKFREAVEAGMPAWQSRYQIAEPKLGEHRVIGILGALICDSLHELEDPRLQEEALRGTRRFAVRNVDLRSRFQKYVTHTSNHHIQQNGRTRWLMFGGILGLLLLFGFGKIRFRK